MFTKRRRKYVAEDIKLGDREKMVNYFYHFSNYRFFYLSDEESLLQQQVY